MLFSSKTDESHGIETFEVYSSYITLASNIFKQAKTLRISSDKAGYFPK